MVVLTSSYQLARAWGCSAIALHVDPCNEAAHALYKNNGYKDVMEEPWLLRFLEGRQGGEQHGTAAWHWSVALLLGIGPWHCCMALLHGIGPWHFTLLHGTAAWHCPVGMRRSAQRAAGAHDALAAVCASRTLTGGFAWRGGGADCPLPEMTGCSGDWNECDA